MLPVKLIARPKAQAPPLPPPQDDTNTSSSSAQESKSNNILKLGGSGQGSIVPQSSQSTQPGSVTLRTASNLGGRVVLGVKRKADEISENTTSSASNQSTTSAVSQSSNPSHILEAFNCRPVSQFSKIAQLGQGTYGTVFRFVVVFMFSYIFFLFSSFPFCSIHSLPLLSYPLTFFPCISVTCPSYCSPHIAIQRSWYCLWRSSRDETAPAGEWRYWISSYISTRD